MKSRLAGTPEDLTWLDNNCSSFIFMCLQYHCTEDVNHILEYLVKKINGRLLHILVKCTNKQLFWRKTLIPFTRLSQ